MNYDFRKFEGTNVRLERRITITRTMSIGFPTKFSEENNIKSFKYVVLFFDETNKALGIQFTSSEEEKNKFTMIKSDKYGASVIARSFFKSKNIDMEKYHGRYDWKIVNQEGIGKLFVIELDNPKLEKK